MRCCICVGLVGLLALGLPPRVSHAQTRAQLTDARQLYLRGLEHHRAERYAEALESFQRSRAIVERPETVHGIGLSLHMLGRDVEALEVVGAYLRGGGSAQDEEARDAMSALLAAAGARVGTLELEVAPEDAEVLVDGMPRARSGPRYTIHVEPGEHRVEVRAAGFAAQATLVSLAAGERRASRVPLRALDDAVRDRAAEPAATGDSRESLVGPLVVLGVAAAGIVTFAIAGGVALFEHDRLSDLCGTIRCTEAHLETLHNITVTADVGWVTALVAAAAGTAWLVVALTSGSEAERPSALRAILWASPDGAGVVFVGALENPG